MHARARLAFPPLEPPPRLTSPRARTEEHSNDLYVRMCLGFARIARLHALRNHPVSSSFVHSLASLRVVFQVSSSLRFLLLMSGITEVYCSCSNSSRSWRHSLQWFTKLLLQSDVCSNKELSRRRVHSSQIIYCFPGQRFFHNLHTKSGARSCWFSLLNISHSCLPSPTPL